MNIVKWILAAAMALAALSAAGQRRITPVNTPATATQPINELEGDTARINARIRASMAQYTDAQGNIVYVDTVTGREWRDSAAMSHKKPMVYPLWQDVSVGVDIWDPVMRCLGQKYGLVGFSLKANLHNRYQPLVDIGLGCAKNTPSGNNFTYRSPLSVYCRLGFDYNFLYNKDSDYQFFAGARVGFTPFSYSLTDISISGQYWGEDAHPQIPSQHATALWAELCLGLKVKLAGPISAGWTLRVRKLLSESSSAYGEPWYIPGYGTRGSGLTGAFSIYYTLPISKARPAMEGE